MTVAIADPLIGSVIGGRYEVLSKVAKGGMGTIYEVRNTKLGRTFALKTITAEAAQDPEVLARFRREADVVANLSHPNIVEVVDWDQLDDGAPFLVMEYLRGETLARRLFEIGALSWPQVARICDQVLSALSVAHHAGVIHRDLKPDNIFLATDDAGEEYVKLLDFGISKIRDSQTFATTDARMLGTPAYMAPEQAEGQHDAIGPATDVWAMGAIIYEMITGTVAFNAPSTPAILYRVCHGRPTPANELRPDIPLELVELLDWTIDPKLRLGDVDELRDELRRVLGDLEGVTWATPMRSRTHESLRRVSLSEFPRVSTPLPISSRSTPMPMPRARTPQHLPIEAASEPVIPAAAAPVVLPTAPSRSRGRVLLALGGVMLFVASAAIVFSLVRDHGSNGESVDPVASPTEIAAQPNQPNQPGPVAPKDPASDVTPETVDVTIASAPRGADVYRMPSQLKVGTTPWTAQLERADGVAVFVVKGAGYRDSTVEIDLRTGGTATAQLTKVVPSTRSVRKPQPPPKQPPKQRDRRKGEPVNPFDKALKK
jgi:serine/threonine-protein kinase